MLAVSSVHYFLHVPGLRIPLGRFPQFEYCPQAVASRFDAHMIVLDDPGIFDDRGRPRAREVPPRRNLSRLLHRGATSQKISTSVSFRPSRRETRHCDVIIVRLPVRGIKPLNGNVLCRATILFLPGSNGASPFAAVDGPGEKPRIQLAIVWKIPAPCWQPLSVQSSRRRVRPSVPVDHLRACNPSYGLPSGRRATLRSDSTP